MKVSSSPLTGSVNGNEVSIRLDPHEGMGLRLGGTVDGDKMSGTTVASGAAVPAAGVPRRPWTAARQPTR